MKKSIWILIILFLIPNSKIKAEDWTDMMHEVSFSYGVFPVQDLLGYYENYFVKQRVKSSMEAFDDKAKFGAFSVSYLFYPDENIGLGLIYSYHNGDKEILKGKTPIGTCYSSFHTIAPSFKYNWYNYDYFTLYTRINMGVSIATAKFSYFDLDKQREGEKTEVKPFFMYQVSPIGVELGRQVAGFLEAGFGHLGTVTVGLRYRL